MDAKALLCPKLYDLRYDRFSYSDPLLDMHIRMKEALVLLGRLDAAHARPPLAKLEQTEIERIGSLLSEANITASTVYENAICASPEFVG